MNTYSSQIRKTASTIPDHQSLPQGDGLVQAVAVLAIFGLIALSILVCSSQSVVAELSHALSRYDQSASHGFDVESSSVTQSETSSTDMLDSVSPPYRYGKAAENEFRGAQAVASRRESLNW
ncbi:hypothetical protein VFPPC_17001 [Pochonia chlamydosporia 170]|uniref:Transmembrane protein n=1 Tax=Pochonia chlamydosporia 170 TaxID=1380566 RepID=A0A179EYH9_METCM|nr:hypothetical protein VFPPC_17001 [Pochonia chlamydosporia 170]OAQ58244.2 hypothetical protein VFPPC_17001 [Pochonia chlamydosporia 170]